jgi:hypothetical protein
MRKIKRIRIVKLIKIINKKKHSKLNIECFFNGDIILIVKESQSQNERQKRGGSK